MDTTTTDPRRVKKLRLSEYKEYDKILQTLDDANHHNLSSHLLNTARHKSLLPRSTRNRRNRSQVSGLLIHDAWTAWPLPAEEVHFPEPVPSSVGREGEEGASGGLRAEIEAAVLRMARERIMTEDGSEERVSANEHPPYEVTRHVCDHVLRKLNRLLHSLARVKYSSSERARTRELKSKWDEIVGIAALSQCIDSPETMTRITTRCKKLFNQEMTLEIDNDTNVCLSTTSRQAPPLPSNSVSSQDQS
jgi:RNA polymerase I specific transcription initiation factor